MVQIDKLIFEWYTVKTRKGTNMIVSERNFLYYLRVKFKIFFCVNHMVNCINQFGSKNSEQSSEFDSNLQMLAILKASQKI